MIGRRIHLVLPYPPSANVYWRSVTIGGQVRMLVSKKAREYKAEVRSRCMEAGLFRPFKDRVEVHLSLYPERPQDWAKRAAKDPLRWDDTVRCMDLGNCEKVMGDALQGHAYVNDGQVWQMLKKRCEPDEYGARLVVTIFELEQEDPRGQLGLDEPVQPTREDERAF